MGVGPCYICLEGGPEGDLVVPCGCQSRPVHRRCLARWQLQAAGTREETRCRFCDSLLPDWRDSLASAAPCECPVMAVRCNGRTACTIRVLPGPAGIDMFKKQVKQILGVTLDEYEVGFEFMVPGTQEKVQLSGLGAYAAATDCAAVVAGERRRMASHSRGRGMRFASQPGSIPQHLMPAAQRATTTGPVYVADGCAAALDAHSSIGSSSNTNLSSYSNIPSATSRCSAQMSALGSDSASSINRILRPGCLPGVQPARGIGQAAACMTPEHAGQLIGEPAAPCRHASSLGGRRTPRSSSAQQSCVGAPIPRQLHGQSPQGTSCRGMFRHRRQQHQDPPYANEDAYIAASTAAAAAAAAGQQVHAAAHPVAAARPVAAALTSAPRDSVQGRGSTGRNGTVAVERRSPRTFQQAVKYWLVSCIKQCT